VRAESGEGPDIGEGGVVAGCEWGEAEEGDEAGGECE